METLTFNSLANFSTDPNFNLVSIFNVSPSPPSLLSTVDFWHYIKARKKYGINIALLNLSII